jgi:sugar lactone lactonase YvrE
MARRLALTALVLTALALAAAGCPADFTHFRQGSACEGTLCPPGQTCAADGTCLVPCDGAGACAPDPWNAAAAVTCHDDGLCHFSCAAGGACPTGMSCSETTGLCGGTSRPEVVVGGLTQPGGFALDGTNVYWTDSYTADTTDPNSGTVAWRPISGGTTVTLATGVGVPTEIVVDATHAYWIDSYHESVMAVALAGDTPVTLAASQTGLRGLSLDADGLYWVVSDAGSTTVMTAPLGGGSPHALATSPGAPGDLVLAAGLLYWTSAAVDYGDPGSVWQVPRSGGTPTLVASADGTPSGLAVDASGLCWLTFDETPIPPALSLFAVALTGGTPLELASWNGSLEQSGTRPGLDATSVYYGRRASGLGDSSDAVMKQPRGGGPAVAVATGFGWRGGPVVADATSVYFLGEQYPSGPGVLRARK